MSMMPFSRYNGSRLAEVVVGIIAVLATLGCVATTDLHSTPEGKFKPGNAERYPELITPQKHINAIINQKLNTLVDMWQCPVGGESQFNIDRHALSSEYLSIEYSAMQHCEGMPAPNSLHSAVTFSLSDGEEVTLELLTQCQSIDQVTQQIGIAATMAVVDSCPEPRLSGNYFIDENTITLLNFYPSHKDTGCEFELEERLQNLLCE